jgi:hypothetical protein
MIHVVHMIRRRHPVHGNRIVIALLVASAALLSAGLLMLFP